MKEYLPNRFECCGKRIRFADKFCSQCGERVPRRKDTDLDIAIRYIARILKTAETHSEDAMYRCQMELDTAAKLRAAGESAVEAERRANQHHKNALSNLRKADIHRMIGRFLTQLAQLEQSEA